MGWQDAPIVDNEVEAETGQSTPSAPAWESAPVSNSVQTLTPQEVPRGEGILEANNAWVSNLATPAMVSDWENKGSIGIVESYQRLNKWEMLPVLNGKTLIDDIAVVKSFNSFKNGEVLSNEEKANMKEFVLDMAEVQTRGYSIGGKIVDGGLRMPAYIGEMALAVGISAGTLGIGAPAAVGGALAKQGAKTAAKSGAKAFARKALKKGAQAAGVSAVGTGTVMLPRVAKKGVNDHLNDSIGITDKGKLFVQEAERAPAEYALRAASSVFVENFVELAGGEALKPVVGVAGKAVSKALPKKFVTGFQKLMKETEGGAIRGALKKGGFSGVLEEIGEERLTDLLITSFDLDPERGYSSEQFLSAMFPDRDDFLAEAGIITIMGSSSRAARGFSNKLRSRGVSEKEIDLALKNMSELEKESALASFEELESKTPDAQLAEATASLEALESVDVGQLDQEQFDTLEDQIDNKIVEVDQLQSAVDQRLEEINAQVGDGILPVPKRPETLSQFIKKAGGIRTDTGEGVKLTRKETPELKGVASRNGTLSLDEARALAVEAGFLRDAGEEGVTQSTEQDLLDALEQEALGRDVVRGIDIDAADIRASTIDFNHQQDQLNKETASKAKELKSFKSAFKDGVRSAQKDVKAVQKALKGAIDKTNLDTKDKEKFTNRIIETQTVEQLRKIAPDIQKRVEDLLGAASARTQKANLKSELSPEAIKSTIVSGKKTGKFTAGIQNRLEQLKGALSLNAESAQIALSNNLKADGAQDATLNKILNIKANPSSVSAADIASAITDVKSIKTLGVVLADKRRTDRKFDANEVRDQIISHITSIDPDAQSRKKTGVKAAGRSIRQFGRSAVSLIGGSWNELIDRVAPESMGAVLGVRRELSRAKQIKRDMQERLTLAADTAFGTAGNAKKLTDELVAGDKIIPLGVFEDANGDMVSVDVSRSQARKLWMASQNTDILDGTIKDKNGNAYTDEMLEAIFSILDRDRGDYAFAQAQLDIYEDFYGQINEVYARVFGIDLPRVDFYSPISRESDTGDTNADVFLRDIDTRRALASGSAIHIRDANASSALVLKTDINAYASHMNEMANFIALREKTMLLDSVFGNAKLRKKIELTFGKAFNNEIKDTMGAIAGINKAQTNAIEKSVNYLNRNFATSVLGLKAKIGLTQLASFPSYAETIPVKDFLSGSADFFLNYKKAIGILGKSELMMDRGSSVAVDIANMGKTFDVKFLKKVSDGKSNLIDYTLIFTKFGDRAAIYVGGWSVYKHAIDNGKTPEQAMAAFEAATADTQQSKDVDQLSYFQRQNAVTRGLVMFMSAPIAQFRGEIRVVRRFKKGEASVAELAKGLIIYHVLIPQIYTALANGIIAGEIDGEDQFRAFMLGSLAGLPLLGDAINAGFRAAQGKSNQPKDALKAAETLVDAISHAYEAMDAGIEGDYEEAIEALVELGKDAAKIEGLPVAGVETIASGIEDLIDGDIKEGALKAAGFPKSVTGK